MAIVRSCSEHNYVIHRAHPSVQWNYPVVGPSTIGSNQVSVTRSWRLLITENDDALACWIIGHQQPWIVLWDKRVLDPLEKVPQLPAPSQRRTMIANANTFLCFLKTIQRVKRLKQTTSERSRVAQNPIIYYHNCPWLFHLSCDFFVNSQTTCLSALIITTQILHKVVGNPAKLAAKSATPAKIAYVVSFIIDDFRNLFGNKNAWSLHRVLFLHSIEMCCIDLFQSKTPGSSQQNSWKMINLVELNQISICGVLSNCCLVTPHGVAVGISSPC